MTSQSALFADIFQCLEKGYEAASSPVVSQHYPFTLLHQQIGCRSHCYPLPSDQSCKTSGQNNDNLWMRSGGHRLSYPRYSTTESVPTDYPFKRKTTIQQELMYMMTQYKSYVPFQFTTELPQPSPFIPQFQNEFADCRLEEERRRPEFRSTAPPPPARTTGLKHCKFCKKNGEHPVKYMSHQLFIDNEVVCPILATFTCANCNQKGHTR